MNSYLSMRLDRGHKTAFEQIQIKDLTLTDNPFNSLSFLCTSSSIAAQAWIFAAAITYPEQDHI